jgi:hypothetical protein
MRIKFLLFIFAGVIATPSSNSAPIRPTNEAVRAYHLAVSGDTCDADLANTFMTYELGQGNLLVIVPCDLDAYQRSDRAYIRKVYDDGNDTIAQVMVLEKNETLNNALVSSLELTSTGFDQKKRILKSVYKNTNLGDCGQSSLSKVMLDEEGNAQVKTIEIRHKSNCDGKVTRWPVVFRQK